MTTSEGRPRRAVRREARLDAEELCVGRLVPDPAVPLPAHVIVYDVEPDRWQASGDLVSVSPAEERAWADARRAYFDTLSRALEDLYRAHGGRHVEVHFPGGYSRRGLRRQWRCPGWRKRAAQRSGRAQRLFLERVAAAEELYRPVRNRIERCVQETAVAEQRRMDELRRQMVQQQRRLRSVADRPVWVVDDDGVGDVVHRVDVPPSPPDDTASISEPLTAAALEAVLRRPRPDRLSITWDEAACDAVERECAAQGESVTFGTWWDSVTTGAWRTERAEGTWVSVALPDPATRPAAASGAHSHYHSYSGTIPTSGTF